MKQTQEEHVNEIKEVLKLIKKSKKDWKSVPKWASQYETDVTWLMRELAKAEKYFKTLPKLNT